MNIIDDQFRKVLGQFPTGVAVITTTNESGEDVGITISSFTSLSLNPHQILFCLSKNSTLWSSFKNTKCFAVNILNADQSYVSDCFAKRAPLDWSKMKIERHAPSGCILLTEALGHVICEKGSVFDGGDHDIIIGLVTDLFANPHTTPLIRHRGEYMTTEGLLIKESSLRA
jgi:flavin reductase (DIM6/NTAB) family NADH-FMN oxidoreductase RutF